MSNESFNLEAFKNSKVSLIINAIKAKKAFKEGNTEKLIASTTNMLHDMLNIALDIMPLKYFYYYNIIHKPYLSSLRTHSRHHSLW